MSTEPIISLHNVSKKFRRKGRRDHTMLSRLVHPNRIGIQKDMYALRDVSFDVYDGEIFGIIGNNAAGKSTLLRTIAGILEPDAGDISVQKPVTSIMQLGAGMRYQLTVRDNIALVCSLYGMSMKDTKEVFSDIIAFGELEQYTDMFTYQLSSGFQQRLAFSIAVHSKPQILLLDEVFSAGDKGFQRRAILRMRKIIQGDTTVLMVSHDMKRMLSLCNRVLWLENGTVKKVGEAEAIIAAYT